MKRLRVLKNAQDHYTKDAHQLLKSLSKDKEIKSVVVISYKKDGSAKINRSLSTFNEVCFMKCSLDAWLYSKWQEE